MEFQGSMKLVFSQPGRLGPRGQEDLHAPGSVSSPAKCRNERLG